MAQVKTVRRDLHATENAKVNPDPNSNQLKDSDDVSGNGGRRLFDSWISACSAVLSL
jgi:hypothetical protein